MFSHVKEGHDRTGAHIAQSRARLETITLVRVHAQARKLLTYWAVIFCDYKAEVLFAHIILH